ncbi:MAG: hypothetical protein FWD67_03985 [Betaproteobacteria bacterium]|nr:hypothetical protein [Betaproteobacteria bacterium]
MPKPSRVKHIRHHPAIPYQEIGGFFKLLNTEKSIVARALEFTIGEADKDLDYLEVVHVLIRRTHSSGSTLHQTGKAHRGDHPAVGLSDKELS